MNFRKGIFTWKNKFFKITSMFHSLVQSFLFFRRDKLDTNNLNYQ